MDQDNQKNNSDKSKADKSREAAANIIRNQLEEAYSGNEKKEPAIEAYNSTDSHSIDKPQSQTDLGPYERTYVESSPEIRQREWEQYQSAWQDYYQKYYEKYYTHHYQAAQKAISRQKAGIIASRQAYQSAQSKKTTSTKSNQSSQAPRINKEGAESKPATLQKPAASQKNTAKEDAPVNFFGINQSKTTQKTRLLSEEEASNKLRRRIQQKIRVEATKVRKSRHFMPFMSASAAIIIFLFLQFNQLVISNVVAYVSPGSIDPQNIVIDTPQNINVDPAPRLIIPKVNVDVPVHYDIGTDTSSQNAAMRDGLAHFPIPGANSHPGEIGNTAIAGHSSGDLFMNSQYKFIFAQLHKLEPGDKIYANYNGKRYTYAVTRMETVYPNEVNKLVYDTNGKPVMTLITCTPLGTSLQRLLVTAEQISPDPLKATSAPSDNDTGTSTIPGNEPTWITKIFNGLFGIE